MQFPSLGFARRRCPAPQPPVIGIRKPVASRPPPVQIPVGGDKGGKRPPPQPAGSRSTRRSAGCGSGSTRRSRPTLRAARRIGSRRTCRDASTSLPSADYDVIPTFTTVLSARLNPRSRPHRGTDPSGRHLPPARRLSRVGGPSPRRPRTVVVPAGRRSRALVGRPQRLASAGGRGHYCRMAAASPLSAQPCGW